MLQVNRIVRNEHFGKGIPDYEAVSSKKGKWMVQVQGDGYVSHALVEAMKSIHLALQSPRLDGAVPPA